MQEMPKETFTCGDEKALRSGSYSTRPFCHHYSVLTIFSDFYMYGI